MKKRSKLNFEEYQVIYEKYYKYGWSKTEIAVHTGRSKSTISRLLAWDEKYYSASWQSKNCFEKALYAWQKHKDRMSKRRRRLRLKTQRIRKLVIFILRKWQWSPEDIAEFLTAHGLRISAKAIYNFIKKEFSYLKEHLRLRGRIRKQRVVRSRSIFRVGVPNKKSIHLRPSITGAGHWETDTILSRKGSKGGILTIRELESKKCHYFIIPNLKAESVIRVLLPFFQSQPVHMRKTLTSDNGAEFAELYKLEKVIKDFGVYYCDPYKAWQRGSVENANKLLRWFFPKKTDFNAISEKELRAVEYKINGKPMRVHNYRSATAVFNELVKAA